MVVTYRSPVVRKDHPDVSYGPPPSDRPVAEGSAAPIVLLLVVIVVLIGIGVLGVTVHKIKKTSSVVLPPVTTTTTTSAGYAGPVPTTTAPIAPQVPNTTIAPPAGAGTTLPATTPTSAAGTPTSAAGTPTSAAGTPSAAAGTPPRSLSNTGGPATEAPALALLGAALLALSISTRAARR